MSGKLIYNLKRKRCDHERSAVDSDSDEREVANKVIKFDEGDEDSSSTSASNNEDGPSGGRRAASRGNDNFLREALRKIQELENELAQLEEDDFDSGHEDEDDETDEGIDETHMLHAESEALGFAVCAKETLSFLAAEGMAPDNPIVLALRSRLVGKCDSIPI